MSGDIHSANIASGNARVGMQIGHVSGGGDDDAMDRAERDKARAERRAAYAAARAEAAEVKVTNVRKGNATVGHQYDEVHGDVNVTMPPRTTRTKETNMTTAATISSGEVTDLESARNVAAEIANEAAGDLDDANADAATATESQQRDETFAASLARQNYGARVIALARQLAETSAEIKAGADQRAFAADKRQSLAQAITVALDTAEGARE